MIKTYDTYKDSGIAWIGNIPSGWTTIKNKYLYKFLYSGGTPTASEGLFYSDEGCPFVSISDMSTNEYVTETKKHLTKAGLADKKLKVLQKGTILYSIYATVGAVSELKIDASISQAMLAIRLKDSINKEYYKYNLKTMKEYIYSQANGNTQVNLNADKVSNFNICYPSISEQQTIASFLDKKCGEIDELLSVQEQMINELQAYKQSIITEAVTKGLNPNAQMKDCGIEWIGEIPNGWTICRFKNVAKVKANLVHPDNYLDMQQIAPDCIEKGSGKILKSRTVKDANIISDNHLFYKGQIVYSKIRPTLNKVIIAPYDGLCCADMYPIETTLENKFCLYQMLSSFFYEQVGVVVQDRVKMPKINKEELDQITILVPPVNEQKEIAAYLDEKTAQIDSLIALKQEKITELKDYKKSIIYEYVTGKKKV